MTVIYCARWVLPISSPPIEDGALAVEGDLILAVGGRPAIAQSYPNARVETFHHAAILPGLINAHSHLELTAMRGFLDNEEGNFFSWLKKLTETRLERMTSDDLYASAAWGLCEAARAGVVAVGDASDGGYESLSALRDSGLRGTVFQESFGPDPKLATENFDRLVGKVERLRGHETTLARAGVSPHAPYTVCAPQLKLISEFANAEKVPLMMHAAESAAEDLLLREGRGPFAEGLARRGVEFRAPGTSTVRYLDDLGILQTRPLLAHCIRVDDSDLETLASSKARVAHCPKSNARLGHGRAPFASFLEKRIEVGLGSDSVASNNICDLLEEARFATLLQLAGSAEGETTRVVKSTDALFAATSGGARALGLENISGELRAGLQADLTVVSLSGVHQSPAYDPISALVYASSASDVVLTVVAGREVFRDGRVTTLDENRLRVKIEMIAANLRS